ncbi:MAG: hypothetical protein V2J13_10140 [Cycloclasticus sp.]|jgi:hypothetical protein|nr:hypothetical protein [Cycloclasticus sp.]MEE4292094.1 hypothetical protein [Cycloclasticus sp.]
MGTATNEWQEKGLLMTELHFVSDATVFIKVLIEVIKVGAACDFM